MDIFFVYVMFYRINPNKAEPFGTGNTPGGGSRLVTGYNCLVPYLSIERKNKAANCYTIFSIKQRKNNSIFSLLYQVF